MSNIALVTDILTQPTIHIAGRNYSLSTESGERVSHSKLTVKKLLHHNKLSAGQLIWEDHSRGWKEARLMKEFQSPRKVFHLKFFIQESALSHPAKDNISSQTLKISACVDSVTLNEAIPSPTSVDKNSLQKETPVSIATIPEPSSPPHTPPPPTRRTNPVTSQADPVSSTSPSPENHSPAVPPSPTKSKMPRSPHLGTRALTGGGIGLIVMIVCWSTILSFPLETREKWGQAPLFREHEEWASLLLFRRTTQINPVILGQNREFASVVSLRKISRLNIFLLFDFPLNATKSVTLTVKNLKTGTLEKDEIITLPTGSNEILIGQSILPEGTYEIKIQGEGREIDAHLKLLSTF